MRKHPQHEIGLRFCGSGKSLVFGERRGDIAGAKTRQAGFGDERKVVARFCKRMRFEYRLEFFVGFVPVF